jgi:chemotaxis methyl-accepting protein methylase
MMNDECGLMNESPGEIILILDRVYGRDISLYDESFLMKSIGRRLAETGITTIEAYGRVLSESSPEAQAFLQSLNINYSEFFRNPLSFALLEQVILPGLAAQKENKGRPEIRIWSAACAAGQEAYSIAILLDELAAARSNAMSFRLFATDISENDLALAKKGVFDDAAVQNVRMKHLRRYFIRTGDTYTAVPALRDRIDFSAYDLLEEGSTCPAVSIYGDFDLVICSNLLFYYRVDIRQRILNKIYHCLSADGYLVTGEAEREMVAKMAGFRAVDPFAPVFQKKK